MAVTSKVFNFLKIRNLYKFQHSYRHNSSICRKIVYDSYGDPASVLRLEESAVEPPTNEQVTVKILAAPVNPADINTIQGVYPLKPSSFPAVPGGEAIGEIVKVGEKVKRLKLGDWVVPAKLALGTWRTHVNCTEDQLQKISNDIDIVSAATMTVNPCTAYRMLKDFVDLEPGDVVIQNGANSACGHNVIQLCKVWGIQTVNVVRNRPDLDELKANLTSLGANFVVTEDELGLLALFKEGLPKPKLGLNCVGGKNCLNMLRHLNQGGTLVTYGGMSREPVTVPTSTLIFKDITLRGFWMSRWKQENAGSSDHVVMMSEITKFSKDGSLRPPPYELVAINDFKDVISKAMNMSGKTGLKYIFDFTK